MFRQGYSGQRIAEQISKWHPAWSQAEIYGAMMNAPKPTGRLPASLYHRLPHARHVDIRAKAVIGDAVGGVVIIGGTLRGSSLVEVGLGELAGAGATAEDPVLSGELAFESLRFLRV